MFGFLRSAASLIPGLASSRAAAARMLDGFEAPMSLWDARSRLVAANPAFAALVGAEGETLPVGRGFREILLRAAGRDGGVAEADAFAEEVLSMAARREPLSAERPLGDGRTVRLSVRPSGAGWSLAAEDVTDRRAAETLAASLARVDALTGIPNRRMFLERLEEAVSRPEGCAVLYLDLDRFKSINDTYGHGFGDELLRGVAARLRACLRPGDVVARLGGDEFCAMLPAAGEREAVACASRVVETLSRPFDIEGVRIVTGTSVGVALAPRDAADADGALAAADRALYAAKADGRGTFHVFTPGLDSSVRQRRELEAEMRTALAEGGFRLFYQPIVDAECGTVRGFEALLRWPHPTRGLVPPSDFIPVAEESRLIVQLGAWALRKACCDATHWPGGKTVAVNISPVQFLRNDVVETVRDALDVSGLEPSRLELEITESVLMRDPAATAAVLRGLRELGVRVAMDDFGTGYSSLSYIRDFPFDKIKIDKSFVDGIGKGTATDAVVRAVIDMARGLSMQTVAEGVETEEQWRRLRLDGCNRIQGFFFGRPMPASDVAALLADEARIAA